MSEKNSVSSHSNNYDYYQLDYYDFEDTDSYYSGREEYSMKQQEDPDIINEKFISIPTFLERQDNILTLIGPGLVGLFVLISSVTAIASMSAACASVAVAEALTNSTTSINLVCQINIMEHLFSLKKKNPTNMHFSLMSNKYKKIFSDSFQQACLFGTLGYLK